MSRVLGIAVDVPLRRLFDYRAPPGVDPSGLQPGVRLWVPFGRRRVTGILVEVRPTSDLPESKLRAAIAVIDETPVLDAPLLELLRWAADYYRHPPGEVIAAALPVPLRTGAAALETEERWTLSAAARTGELPPLSPRAHRLQEMVAALGKQEAADAAMLAGLSPRWREHVRELEQRGWVLRLREVSTPAAPRQPGVGAGLEPTPEQQRAIEAISAAAGRPAPFLLHGVTGSGKTEVYLRAIAEVVRRGQQALVLVPEISLTPQLVARFAARFDAPLAVLHSSLSDQERLRAWRAARSGEAPVVIGTRSAIFAPLARPGLIVVDEEHDSSYKQQEGFRYSGRDLAVLRASRAGIPVVLGSATPSFESLANVAAGRYARLSLPERTGRAGKPRVAVVDLRINPARDGLSPQAAAAIERHLGAGGQVLVFLNRRGWAPTLFCPGCGYTVPCKSCDARLTVHMGRARLVCHHCGADEPMPYGCPRCGNELAPVGEGTERVEAALAAHFPAAPLVRVDRDVIRRRGEMEEALSAVADGRARILLGTQMLTKGHDFPDVTLVVVLAADQGLFGADFRASERLAQQIVQVAGRAGRGDRPGEVLIQSAYPEHPLLQCLIREGYEGFALKGLEERRAAGWPPYSHLALLRADAPARGEVHAFLRAALAAQPANRPPDLRVLGPAPAAMERRAGRHRAQLLLESSARAALQRFLAEWLPEVVNLRAPRALRWSVDVDPIEID